MSVTSRMATALMIPNNCSGLRPDIPRSAVHNTFTYLAVKHRSSVRVRQSVVCPSITRTDSSGAAPLCLSHNRMRRIFKMIHQGAEPTLQADTFRPEVWRPTQTLHWRCGMVANSPSGCTVASGVVGVVVVGVCNRCQMRTSKCTFHF